MLYLSDALFTKHLMRSIAFLSFLQVLIHGYITSVSLKLFILSKISERFKIIIVKIPAFKIIQMVTNVFFGKRSLRVPNIKQSSQKDGKSVV